MGETSTSQLGPPRSNNNNNNNVEEKKHNRSQHQNAQTAIVLGKQHLAQRAHSSVVYRSLLHILTSTMNSPV